MPGRPMIHHASFRNFKALRNVEITFDSRLTVLVGPNGSGKTSVLQGIHFLCQLLEGRSVLELLRGRRRLDRISSRNATGGVRLELTAGNDLRRTVRLQEASVSKTSQDGLIQVALTAIAECA